MLPRAAVRHQVGDADVQSFEGLPSRSRGPPGYGEIQPDRTRGPHAYAGNTPAVEPISIDEAFLDLTGTERLHGGPPAQTLAKLAARIEAKIGITVSIGLSYNKFLAKLASGLQKPSGFSVIGRAEAVAFLRELPVGMMWGVGPITQAQLERDGIKTIGALAATGEA